MKFPYGISDFYKLITEAYLYIDRTDRLPLLEEAGSTLLFLCPQRYGKRLLLLENYGSTGTQGFANHLPGRFDRTLLSGRSTFREDLGVNYLNS